MTYKQLTDDEIDAELERVLAEHKKTHCPGCGKHIDRGDCSWNSGSTEAGTDYSVLNIICEQCVTEIVHILSWYPDIESFQEFVEVLNNDWTDLCMS